MAVTKWCRLYCILLSTYLMSWHSIATDNLPTKPHSAYGVVYADHNGDGVLNATEPGIAGVAVSNGRDVVRTDDNGHYRLAVAEGMTIFVVQPRGYNVPTDDNGLPHFYHVHMPHGSKPGLDFPGLAPTGALPAPLNFALQPQHLITDNFSVLLLGDTQTRNALEVAYLANDILAPLKPDSATMAIALGDLVYDDLSLFEPLIATIGSLGLPWWPVIGNHDINFRSVDDSGSADTWKRLFGPTNYAFQVGQVHFIVLDSDHYDGWDEKNQSRGGYSERIGADALQFLRAYLDTVPRREMIVIATHVPLKNPAGKLAEGVRQLLALLSDRPHSLSFSAHAHRQFQVFLGSEDGFTGTDQHHHINVGATSGSWWAGERDEYGIPHTTMRDGTPNGYWLAHFTGTDYRLNFYPARRRIDHQINISAPFSIPATVTAEAQVLANVYAGSERTQVHMRIDQGPWQLMQPAPLPDPFYQALVAREESMPPDNRRRLPAAVNSTHIWSRHLPANLAPGVHTLSIRAVDPFAGTLQGRHIFNVEDR